jgi:hypothetical protein
LLVAVCNQINEAVAGALDSWKDPRELFQHFTDPEAWPWERLFFELYAHALFGRPGTEGFVEASVHRWIDVLLDLLATEDREEVNKAYEYYLQLTGQAAD